MQPNSSTQGHRTEFCLLIAHFLSTVGYIDCQKSHGLHNLLWVIEIALKLLLLSICAWLIFPHKETLIKSPFRRIEADCIIILIIASLSCLVPCILFVFHIYI